MTTRNKICPATKEQRDTLIKAMTDAGYTFDFEKKELKKIWSEEDEEALEVDLDKPLGEVKIHTSMESGSLDEVILTTKYIAKK